MDLKDIPVTWSSVAISENEGWQCRQGTVLVSTEAAGEEDRGIWLRKGEAWPFPGGVTVYYRAVSGPARIVREVIA